MALRNDNFKHDYEKFAELLLLINPFEKNNAKLT